MDTLRINTHVLRKSKWDAFSIPFEQNQADYLLNIVRTDSEDSYRITDGSIVIVDSVEGFSSTFETSKLLDERNIPVLMLNKIDRLIFELQMSSEEIYQTLSRTLEHFIAKISEYQNDIPANIEVSPEANNVIFGSGK